MFLNIAAPGRGPHEPGALFLFESTGARQSVCARAPPRVASVPAGEEDGRGDVRRLGYPGIIDGTVMYRRIYR